MLSLKPARLLVSIIIAVPFTLQISKAQSPDAKLKPTGSISGHVMISGKPAQGIDVAAIGSETIYRRLPAAQAKTDSEGYYLISGLAAGNYQVTTYTANLTVAEPGTDLRFGPVYGPSKGVLLATGEQVADIDIKLVRGGVITGKVTDADNKPVVEERVSLQVIEDNGARTNSQLPLNVQLNQTDDRGVYRLYGLPAGRYKVYVGRGEGQVIGSNNFYQQTYYPDTTDSSRATIVELIEGAEATNIDIRVGHREDAYTLTGRVIDSETGVPVSGARIGLIIARGTGYAQNSTGMPTGADGKFSVPGLSAGHYGVYVATDWGQSDFYSDPVSVDVTDKDVTGLEIKAIRGLTVSGTIVAENMDVKMLLKQLPGLRVSANIMPPDGRMTPTTLRSFGTAVVAPDGSFQVTGLRPGKVMIGVASQDQSKRASIVKVAIGGVGVTQGFEIERGQPVTGLQIVVAYGTGVIRGSVSFPGGTVPDFRTEIICRQEGTGRPAGGAYIDARGHFQMVGIPPGTYDCGLQYIKPGGWANRRPPQAQRQSVSVANDMEAELNFVVDLTKGVGP